MSRPPTVDEVQQQIPRQYQNEIFQEAQKSNIIAVMDTGTGKTLIAITLIKWMTTRISLNPNEPRKVVVFIVPKVPLVTQQRDAIEQQTSLTVRGYFGAMDVDYWKREQWAKEFNEADVLVMTPRVLYDLLAHAHWNIDRISLLIFDEAHHCRKNNDYNQIMRDHYHTRDRAVRPKVFGMTASPVWNTKNPLESLRELERNMDARVLAVRDNVSELQKHAPKPKEVVIEYKLTPNTWPAYRHPLMLGQMVQAEELGVRDFERRRFRIRYDATMDCVGIIGAEYYLSVVVPRGIDSLVRDKRHEVATVHKLTSPGEDPSFEVARINAQIAQLEGIKAILVDDSARLFTQSLDIPSEWLAPRIVQLVDLLHRAYTDDPACQSIVFAEQRQVVMVLNWVLRHIPVLRTMIRPTFITGHGGSTRHSQHEEDEITGMSVKEQQAAVRNFREGRANLLVATSVAEEGLDFQPCNLVVRLDEVKTMVSYAQSRGRARQKASTYVVMRLEQSGTDRYSHFSNAEPGLKQAYQNRATTDADLEDLDGEEVSDVDLQRREVYVTSTNAKLTYGNAISLVSRLCAVHPMEPGLPVLKPKYTLLDDESAEDPTVWSDGGDRFGFACIVSLPSALPLPREQLRHVGPFRTSKKEAKRAVAFKAARALAELGCFDEYLLPLQENNDREGVDADGEQFKPLDLDDIFEDSVLHVWGDPWQADQPLFCYPMEYKHYITAGLVTTVAVDLDDVNNSIGFPIDLPRLSEPIVLTFTTAEERQGALIAMEQYTKFAKEWAISRRPYEGHLACFCVKLTADGHPDYTAMKAAIEHPLSLNWRSDYAAGSPLIVIQKTTWTRTYRLLSVKEDTTPSTILASVGRKCCDLGCSTYLQHYAASDSKFQEKKEMKAVQTNKPFVRKPSTFPPISPDEPMVALLPVRNLRPDQPEYLVPSSFIKSVSLENEIFDLLFVLPALLRHIVAIKRARAMQDLLKIPRWRIAPFTEALAIPGAIAKYNYNRLEFFGDTFLKLATSIYIFNKYPHRHEGQLAALREGSVRNTYLRGKSYRLGIHHYTVDEKEQGLKKWIPPVTLGTFMKKGYLHIKQDLKRRCLSDCVESLLGASYLCGGVAGALKAGESMGLCFGGTEPWPQRFPSNPTYFVASTGLRLLQDKLGYEFRDPLLLLEAVTHPTFPDSQTPSYQRLEFLGDAVIDSFVVDYLFTKYPTATAAKLSWMKHLLVCNALLGAVAIRELALHKHVLHMARRLDREIAFAVKQLENLTYSELAQKWWEYDPPKVLNDVLEAVLGAVLVDSGYDIEVCRPVLARLFQGTVCLAHPDIPLHPVMEIYVWAAQNGCDEVHFEKSRQKEESLSNDTYHVIVHDIEISRNTGDSLSVAKCFAAYKARAVLSDPDSVHSLKKLCDCHEKRAEAKRLRLKEKEEKRAAQAQRKLDEQNEREVSLLVVELDKADDLDAGKFIGVVEGPDVEQIVSAILEDPMDASDAAAMDDAKDETNEGFARIGHRLAKVTEQGSPEESNDDEDDDSHEHSDDDELEGAEAESTPVGESMDVDGPSVIEVDPQVADTDVDMADEDTVLWPAPVFAPVGQLP